MPNIGSIEAYDSSELLSAYLERLNEFFLANDIGKVRDPGANADQAAREAAANAADRKKVASFLTIVGKKTYGVIQDLCKPNKPNEKSFEELCNLLKSHYEPKTLEVAESFKFHRCVQNEKETVTEFCTRLRGMAASELYTWNGHHVTSNVQATRHHYALSLLGVTNALPHREAWSAGQKNSFLS
jgi:RNase H-fold protein (predicted Holliday junction resolvase)